MTDAADLILHHAPGSRSVRVLWLLRELDMPHQVVERPLVEWVIDRDYRKVNPSGRLPYLIDRGQPRTESLALMQTLFETRQPDSPLWRPLGHPERADLLQWMQYSETVQTHVQNLNQQLTFIRPPEARSAATVKLEVVRLGRALDVVEQALATRDFLLPGGFSAADIAMGYVVAVSRVFRPLEGQPRLQEYVRRLQARPAAASLLEFPVATAPAAV